MSRRQGLLLIAPLLLVLAGFFLVPVLMLLPTSFGVYEPGTGLIKGAWSLKNYSQIVSDDYYREVIWRTLGLGFSVTLICLLLSYPLAYLIARGPERWPPGTQVRCSRGRAAATVRRKPRRST
ncbi:MAG: hypothetical protein ABS80_17090 [Pseudonocardia sp. SCN 72-51]|nr:MAG: hypothetical protein ABS80_17090 [Pseudonocardia sp. SCN 72-51]